MQAYHNQENPSLSLMLAFGGEVSMLELIEIYAVGIAWQQHRHYEIRLNKHCRKNRKKHGHKSISQWPGRIDLNGFLMSTVKPVSNAVVLLKL